MRLPLLALCDAELVSTGRVSTCDAHVIGRMLEIGDSLVTPPRSATLISRVIVANYDGFGVVDEKRLHGERGGEEERANDRTQRQPAENPAARLERCSIPASEVHERHTDH